MDAKEKVAYWIEIAFDDLDSAKIMLKNKKYLQCGFYCHQAVEKILKGYYWHTKQKEPPYTHNLIKLSSACDLNTITDDSQKHHIDLLMPLHIESRYPDDKFEIYKTLTKQKTTIIYKNTKEFVQWINQLIKK